jgi:hypothetical protein
MREIFGTILVLLAWVGLYLCVRGFFSFIARSGRREQPREEALFLEFFPASAMRLLVRVTLVLLAAFAAFTVAYALARKEEAGLYAALIPMFVFGLVLLANPVAVIIDHEGIRQKRWFRTDKAIAWNDVATVERGPQTGTTYVRSRHGGPKIRFSSSLVGRTRFLREIRVHAPDAEIYSEDDG